MKKEIFCRIFCKNTGKKILVENFVKMGKKIFCRRFCKNTEKKNFGRKFGENMRNNYEYFV